MKSARRCAAILFIPIALGAAACSRSSDTDGKPPGRAAAPGATSGEVASAAPAASVAPSKPAQPRRPRSKPAFEGTAGIVHKKNSGKPAVLDAVRSARHDGFDRLVFEFREARLPGYHVEYIDKPVRRCGSGDTTALAGDGWLEVRLEPAYAHDELGKPTVKGREQMLDLPVVREVELTCDFEAVVTWVLGVASPNRYRVLELTEPSRLVVDIRH